jgi:glycosyltransferase involved in cell wall biosynthesis
MKVAVVTTPPSVRSGIGDYTRHLLPHLAGHCELRVFVAPGLANERLGDLELESVTGLVPRDFDQILYQVGNERSHAFMPALVRAIGGTVMLHDWVLFDLALAAHPALARGGLKGHLLALREGGWGQTRIYFENWRARRRQRLEREGGGETGELQGTLLSGWHAFEGRGRWTGDAGVVRLPARTCRSVIVSFSTEPGRTVRLADSSGASVEFAASGKAAEGELRLELDRADAPEVAIETDNISVSEQQRLNGDTRRLGTFVRSIRYEDRLGLHDVELSAPPARPIRPIYLTRDRFVLPLNRSIVRFGDAFIVHSQSMKRRILEERNAPTPVGVLHHGAEPRWRDDERALERLRLGLPDAWSDAFLVTSFGALQPHKRIHKLLEALALARVARPQIRLSLIGAIEPEELDVAGLARDLGVEDVVYFTGHVPEEVAWSHIHAGDLSIQLRGPSTGGSSGGLFQSLALGRAVIASDSGEQAELPGDCVIGVRADEREQHTLASHLVELCDRPERREAMERAARRFVRDECAWDLVAKQYAECLRAFPGPRASRRSLYARVKAARATASA